MRILAVLRELPPLVLEMTGTDLEDHHRRYKLVVHMESAAVRVPEDYIRFPDAHRPESIEQAATLERLLGELWSGHPNYVKLEGTSGIEEKLSAACSLIEESLSAGNAGSNEDHRPL